LPRFGDFALERFTLLQKFFIGGHIRSMNWN